MRAALALVVLIQTTTAFAQPDAFIAPSTRAAQLFSEGRELKAAGKIDEACARFETSWRAERATGTELNLADCRERQGRLLEAWQLFDEAAQISEREGNTTRATFARNRARALDARLMTLDIRLVTPIAKGTVITIDGRTARTLQTRLDPKPVTIHASAPDGKAVVMHVQARTGRVVVDVPSLVRTKTVRRASRLWVSGGLVLAGAIGAVGAQSLFMLADDQRNNIDGCTLDDTGQGSCVDQVALERAERRLDLADRNELGGKLLLGGSALAIVGAAVVWYTAPKERVLLTPTATPRSVGVSLAARF